MAKLEVQKQVAVFKVSINAIPEGEKRRPHRTIAVDANADLYALAKAINRAFDFDFDHAFGFYDNLKDPYGANTKYELFADSGGADASPFGELTLGALPDALGEDLMQQLAGIDPAALAVARATQQVDFATLQHEIESELEEIVFQHAFKRFQDAFLPHIPTEHREAARRMLEEMAREAYRTPSDEELGGLMDDFEPVPGGLQVDEGTLGVKGTPILSVFSSERPKWCYLFDYGDDWTFEVAFLRLEGREARARYPKVLESKGQAPEQYPDWDDE
jgi:Plasmid pRiA4b ORF-3-like protein